MARFEDAHVTFVDSTGQERHDVTLLDPGASAFLCGCGPLARYLNYFKLHDYPVDKIEFNRCCHRFQFGGDGSSWSHWVVRLPLCISGVLGRAQVFFVKPHFFVAVRSSKPLELIWLSLDKPFDIVTDLGCLPLWESHEDLDLSNLDFQFDLIVAADGEVDPSPCSIQQFEQEEQALVTEESIPDNSPEKPGDRPLPAKQLQTFDSLLKEMHNDLHSYVTSELHAQPSRLIWEVYCGNARTSSLAETLGARVETFSYETGSWDFDLKTHREAFLSRLQAEIPDELLLNQRVALGVWCKVSRRERLSRRPPSEYREWHHEIHLNFVKKAFLTQVRNGAHAHLEQPMHAGRLVPFATYLDFSPCSINASLVVAVWTPMDFGSLRRSQQPSWLPNVSSTMRWASGAMDHTLTVPFLEGHAPGIGRRTQYLEDYQPGLAAVLTACLLFDESPALIDFVGAVNEEKGQMSGIVQLLTENKAEAVNSSTASSQSWPSRQLQEAHRDAGQPWSLWDGFGSGSEVSLCGLQSVPQTKLTVACSDDSFYHLQWAPAVRCDEHQVKENSHPQHDWRCHKVPGCRRHLRRENSGFPTRPGNGKRMDQALRTRASSGHRWRSWLGLWWDAQPVFKLEHQAFHGSGEAHTRLSLVERRHAVLRKAVEIYMTDLGLSAVGGIRQALAYVLPHNPSPTVAGFSPSQWALGFQPNFPGDLTSEGLSPAQLSGAANFELTLERRSAAKQALVKADADSRLRRALLRRYAGQNVVLHPGQSCDARQADLVKIRWLGPALVVLREADVPLTTSGKISGQLRPLLVVWKLLVKLWLPWSHVVWLIDLNRLNKRNIDEVDAMRKLWMMDSMSLLIGDLVWMLETLVLLLGVMMIPAMNQPRRVILQTVRQCYFLHLNYNHFNLLKFLYHNLGLTVTYTQNLHLNYLNRWMMMFHWMAWRSSTNWNVKMKLNLDLNLRHLLPRRLRHDQGLLMVLLNYLLSHLHHRLR